MSSTSSLGKEDFASSTGPEDAARFVLDYLVARSPALLSIDELVREFAGSKDLGVTRVYVEDGLTELMSSGLVNRLEEFVFASRSAVRASELSL